MSRCLAGMLLVLGLSVAAPAIADDAPAVDAGAQDARFAPRPGIHQPRNGNVRLTSVLTRGGEPFDGTRFSILREQPDAYGKMRATTMALAGPKSFADFQLSPGSYRVQARNGAVTIEQQIDVPASGALDSELLLDAGILHLHGLLDATGSEAEQTWFKVFRHDTDAYGRHELVQIASDGYGTTTRFVLPAGEYVAEARFGDARVRAPVRVEAGAEVERELVLDAGRIELSAVLSNEGEAADGVQFTLLKAPDEAGTEPVEFASTSDGSAVTFVLPSGEYIARARLDGAEAESRVTVNAGTTQAIELSLQAGELLVYATLAGRSDALLDSWFSIASTTSDSSDAAPAARGPNNLVRFVLPAGRHRVFARHGESSGFADVEIEAGTRETLPIDLDAGRIRVRLTNASTRAAFPYTWFSLYKVERDTGGHARRHRVFNDGYYATTDVVLPAGEYIAIGRTDRQQGETAFTVEAGTVKQVDIVARR